MLVGSLNDAGFKQMRDVVFEAYRPNKVVGGFDPSDSAARLDFPLFEARTLVEGKATAYVCEDFACQAPTTDPKDLIRQLG